MDTDTDDVDLTLDLEPEPNPDPPAPEAAGDPAAEAFARLEGELALMRRAVQHLAAERADIVIPDYGTTLTDMAKRMGTISESLKGMAGHPAMQMTPDSIGNRIAAAAEAARRTDQDRISQARDDLHTQPRRCAASPPMRALPPSSGSSSTKWQAEPCWRASCYGLSSPAPLPAPMPTAGTGPSAWPRGWSAHPHAGTLAHG
jgi:hypothetical protein